MEVKAALGSAFLLARSQGDPRKRGSFGLVVECSSIGSCFSRIRSPRAFQVCPSARCSWTLGFRANDCHGRSTLT